MPRGIGYKKRRGRRPVSRRVRRIVRSVRRQRRGMIRRRKVGSRI